MANLKANFPQMSIPDIINALGGWGIFVSPEQLKSPSSDFVEGVYCACLQRLTDLTHDSLQDPVQNALTASQAEDKVFQVLHLPFLCTESLLPGTLCVCYYHQHCIVPSVCDLLTYRLLNLNIFHKNTLREGGES